MRLKEGAEFFNCEFCGNIHFPEPNADGVRVLGEPASEDCPVCSVLFSGIHLVHAAVAGLRIRYCSRCRGMLIAMETFVEIVQVLRARREGSADTAQQPDWKDLERHVRCPQCREDMDTHPYGGPGNIILDSCERCEHNWLDYGELQRIVRAPDHLYSTY